MRRREAGSNEGLFRSIRYLHSSDYNILIVEKETKSENFKHSIGVNAHYSREKVNRRHFHTDDSVKMHRKCGNDSLTFFKLFSFFALMTTFHMPSSCGVCW